MERGEIMLMKGCHNWFMYRKELGHVDILFGLYPFTGSRLLNRVDSVPLRRHVDSRVDCQHLTGSC